MQVIEQLLAALRPFDALLQPHLGADPARPVFGINDATVTVGDLLKLRAALAAVRKELAEPQAQGVQRWIHTKTGGLYDDVTPARMEADGSLVMVYRAAAGGQALVRPFDEFHDGRFTPIAAAPQPAQAAEQLCQCGDRPASKCPEPWEPGCDLGANPKHVRVHQATPEEFARAQPTQRQDAGGDAPAGLASEMRDPSRGGLRFHVIGDGSVIDDDDFIFDAMIKINGDFTDEQRLRFGQWVADSLNEADKKLPRAARALGDGGA